MCKGQLIVVSPPTVEPVSLNEVLVHTHADSGPEDDYINNILIPAARVKAEEYLNRGIMSQTVKVVFDGYPYGTIKLPYSPVISVSNIKIYDEDSTETEIELTEFDINTDTDPATVTLKSRNTYPTITLRPVSGFEINYLSGYSVLPASLPKAAMKIKLAIMFLVGWWYTNRGMEQDIPVAFYNTLRDDRLKLN